VKAAMAWASVSECPPAGQPPSDVSACPSTHDRKQADDLDEVGAAATTLPFEVANLGATVDPAAEPVILGSFDLDGSNSTSCIVVSVSEIVAYQPGSSVPI
jgi:hypothetical protein